MNKAHFYDNEVKIEGQLLVPNIIAILVNFGHKMEATLVEMQKLIFESQSEVSWVPFYFQNQHHRN